MPSIRNSAISHLYGGFARGCRWLQHPFLLLVRLYWGWLFIHHGWMKLQHLHGVAAFFGSIGIPAPAIMAPFVACVEVVGGAFLILGLINHLTGLVLAIDMFVAYWTAKHGALHAILSHPGKFYGADVFSFFLASLIIFVFGAGWFSLDQILGLNSKA